MVAGIPFDVDSVDNCSDSTFVIISTATELYKAYIDSLKNKFDSAYTAKCLSAYKLEKFTVKHLASEFHYTLYYYDQAGNLVKIVPPQGVHVNRDSLWLDSVRTARRLGQDKLPAHTLQTQYRYNTLNQVVAQHSPDGGKTEFWYDRLGRLVLSSNAKQKAAGSGENGRLYSYTLYDELGRITEVGQANNTTANGAVTDSITRNESLLSTWYYTLANRRGQITSTVYDVAYTGFGSPSPLQQRNLRNRVSYTTYTDTSTLSSFNNGTFFTYDIHGNVDTLLQHYGNKLVSGLANVMNKNNNGYKKIVYKYDLISGKVNLVAYNPHNIDEFYHRYTYDAENRITLAETSTDSIHWEKEARYDYYRHGPLARTVLGDQQVQGMDYAYTLQGWLKGVNSISLSANFDMGGDGKTGGINQPVAKDEIGFNLNYYTGDYLPINATVNPFPAHTAAAGLASDDNRPLYNGNISSMAVNIKKLIYPGVAAYHYDQLNRITARKSYYNLDQTNNNWNGLTATKSFEEKFSYDANGNILTADRYTSATWGFMDSLTYSYYPGTNKLRRVRDFGFTMYGFNPPDIADQSATDNYTYDEIGNLTSDAQESITNIKWSVYGKILEISRTASTYNPVIKIKYGYDAAGNRISKEVRKNGTDTVEYSWYVRDAQGNIMSTYTAIGDTAGIGLSGLTLNIIDQPLYGSSRLGVLTRQATAEDSWYPFNERSKIRGLKQYELTNHLGNVLATVSDRKTPVQSGTDPTKVDHFDADVQNAFDYYAFGMVMPDRKFTGPAYRFGFNGKEMDNEAKGFAAQYDYGFRIYDPRLGRFLSVDPLFKSYPWYTPYQFAGNKPIIAIDLDGLEDMELIGYWSDPNLRRKAAGLANTDPKALGVLQQTNWNTVVSGIEDIVRKHFDPNRNLDQNGADKVYNELNIFLGSDAVTKYVSVVDYENKGSIDILNILRQKAEEVYNDHFWSAAFGYANYQRDIKSIDQAKDPNEKAILMNGRHERNENNRKFMMLTLLSGIELYGGFTTFGTSNTGESQQGQNLSLNSKTSPSGSAANGVNVEGAVWAQKTFSGTFSAGGKFAGQTVDDVAGMLRSGTLSAADVPINVVVRNGQTLF